MKQNIPNVEMVDREVVSVNVDRPENRELSGITLAFSIRFTSTKDHRFSIKLKVDVFEVNDENEESSDSFMNAEILGIFKTDRKSANKIDHFVAVNMLYPELRMLCVRMLDYMKLDASEFPLSVPAIALSQEISEDD